MDRSGEVAEPGEGKEAGGGRPLASLREQMSLSEEEQADYEEMRYVHDRYYTLLDVITAHRPDLSPSTRRVYAVLLMSLADRLRDGGDEAEIHPCLFCSQYRGVLALYRYMPLDKQKIRYDALLSFHTCPMETGVDACTGCGVFRREYQRKPGEARYIPWWDD